ncbi:hypothetical protein ARMSODRAFT_981859 [Armillaria solidipes]|uniref:Uncharacterized protein n=1 Tax=Armillaria solidipes TaxID=1076256 RepID=A0A2H3BD15_9AGAR|nr:hypothetical protein ARMSODRAFT_981859 [Armillaria solidipes]
MTPTVNLMLYSFSSFSSGLFNRSNVILKGLDCRVQHFFKLRQCYADLCTNPPSCRVSSSHHPLANCDPIYFEMQERLEEGRHGAGGGSASGKTLSLAHVAVIWARDLHTDMCWKLRLDKAGDWMLTELTTLGLSQAWCGQSLKHLLYGERTECYWTSLVAVFLGSWVSYLGTLDRSGVVGTTAKPVVFDGKMLVLESFSGAAVGELC